MTKSILRRMPALGAIVLLASCNSQPAADKDAASDQSAQAPGGQVAQASSLRPRATIKELMDSTVDPAADGVWDAVSVIVDEKGTTHNRPRTQEEWHAVRRHAMTLVEAMNLVTMEGRHAAPAGTKPGLGELPPEEIDRRITANRAEFDSYAQATQHEAIKALAAIDRKDPDALSHVGGDIDARCESCHLVFWYPNSARPES